MKKTAQQMVEEALTRITTLSTAEAAELLNEEGVLFVDLRDIRELQREGRIPDALHAPRGMLEFWACPESPYHRPHFARANRLVLFCAGGWRSALATCSLQELGYENVCHIGGGFSAWKEAGLPVVNASCAPVDP